MTLSIRNRLALSATLLVLIVVGVIASVAYREVRAAALAATGQRLESTSRRLADLLGMSARQVHELARVAAHDTAVKAFLAGSHTAPSQAVTQALSHLATQPALLIVVELWDPSGNRRATTADSVPPMSEATARDLIPLASGRDSVAIGPLAVANGVLTYAVIASVAEHGRQLGYIVQRRRLTGSLQSASQLRDLGGPGTKLFAGNARGDVWTDLVSRVPSLPTGPVTRAEFREYDYSGDRVIAAFAPIPLTPWVLATESPRSAALAPASAMLARLGAITLVLLLLAALGAWAMSRSVTQPIAQLLAVAEGMSAGDESERVDVKRLDEVGVLGVAFNAMAERIARTRAHLEHKIDEVAEAEARYHLLFDASPQASWVYDRETKRFLTVNDAAVRRYGYSSDEFLSLRILDIRPESDVPRVLENLERLGDSDEQSAVWRHRTKDGTLIDVEVSSRAVSFAGRPARLVVVNDLTERRRAEESLRTAQERLERVIGSSGAVLYELRVEPDTTVLEWISGNVHDILGYSPADVRAPRWWSDNVHPEDQVELRNRPRADAYRDRAHEYRFRHKDGRYRWLREEQRLIPGTRGEPTRVVGAWLDITEHRQLEVQFRQAQKMEAVGRLAGGVAHDFNNILTIIIAESQFLVSDPAPNAAELRESADQIRKAGERAAGLTRQLLTFSRRQFVDPTTIDLNNVVLDLDKMLRRLIGEDIDLRVHPAAEALVTTADRGQVEQVMVNLVVNARDAMPDGGVLTVETARVALDQTYADTRADVAPGDYVVLSVSDTGMGMTDEVKAHIFEPFFTTKEAGKGTGLGLATCYAIAKQFGGHISAYSEVGLGTTVKFFLPATAGAPADAVPPPAAVPRGGETILLVEDDAQVRRITSRLLQRLGYTVLEAADAEEARQVFERQPSHIDLLVTDLVLPGLGGRVVAERVRERRPGMPVLFLSGYSDDVVLRHKLASGEMLLLQKPFTEESLARYVREALSAPKRG